ncbi:MAG: nucleotidyltransferase family protein [Candidatus Firestonebacteria bacterium]
MKLAAEEKFLMDIFTLSSPIISGAYDLRSLNWKKITALAENHWLGFYVFKAIKSLQLRVNKKILKNIKKLRKKEKSRFLYFQEKLPQVLEALNKAKINYAVLKGGFLAFDIYPAGARYLSDLDVIVAKKDKAEAVLALVKEGFKEDKNKSNKAVTVVADANGLEVEVAAELGILKNILPVDELLLHTVKVRLLNKMARVLNNEYNLLHICLHASMTHSFYDISKLADINELLKNKELNMKSLEALAEKKGVYRAVFLPVQSCGILWKNKVGLKYNIDAGLAGKLIKRNLESALKTDYDKRSAFYGYLIPVLIADSWNLKFSIANDFLKKKVMNG